MNTANQILRLERKMEAPRDLIPIYWENDVWLERLISQFVRFLNHDERVKSGPINLIQDKIKSEDAIIKLKRENAIVKKILLASVLSVVIELVAVIIVTCDYFGI